MIFGGQPKADPPKMIPQNGPPKWSPKWSPESSPQMVPQTTLKTAAQTAPRHAAKQPPQQPHKLLQPALVPPTPLVTHPFGGSPKDAHPHAIADALQTLYRDMTVCKRARAMLGVMLTELEDVIDGVSFCPRHGSSDPSVLPVQRGSKRTRRIDPMLKAWIGSSVIDGRYRTNADAVRGIEMGVVDPSSYGIEIAEERMRSYFWASAELGSHTQQWAVALDGSDVGEDTSVYAIWLRKFSKGFWAVPQA